MNVLLADTYLIGVFIFLATITVAMYRLRVNLLEPTKKELLALHKKRMELIRTALASSAESGWNVPASPLRYPFESWVKLIPQGVSVGGELLSLDKKFEVVARDDRNISRAAITCDGRGLIVIESHGQSFKARLDAGSWSIQQIQPPHES